MIEERDPLPERRPYEREAAEVCERGSRRRLELRAKQPHAVVDGEVGDGEGLERGRAPQELEEVLETRFGHPANVKVRQRRQGLSGEEGWVEKRESAQGWRFASEEDGGLLRGL